MQHRNTQPSAQFGRPRRVSVILVALAAGVVTAGSSLAADGVIRLSEPVAVTDTALVYGALLDDSLPMVDLDQLATHDDPEAAGNFRLTARVAQVCQAKGCFFIAQQGTTTMRVSFENYSFFVPTDISGKRVTLAGRLVQRELSTEDAEHYARDLGDESPSAVAPGPVYEIVATAVAVPR